VGRNVTFQVLRGSQANLHSAMPLGQGELYFATDTGNLFIGFPGFGIGYVQVGNLSPLSDEVELLHRKVRALELALANLGVDVKEFEYAD
jgi:hypothetical protein